MERGIARSLAVCLVPAVLSACGSPSTQATSEPEAPPENIEVAADFPDSLTVVGNGYPAAGDPCRRLGESAATTDWLDASAVLVGCPTKGAAAKISGKTVGQVEGITVLSVPDGDENAGLREGEALAGIVKSRSPDGIRGQGGLEEVCKKAVEREGTAVVGTNRIEEAPATVDIYVNVRDGAAPWRCRIKRSGEIVSVEFAGDEGRL